MKGSLESFLSENKSKTAKKPRKNTQSEIEASNEVATPEDESALGPNASSISSGTVNNHIST